MEPQTAPEPADLVALVRPDLERHRAPAVEALRQAYADWVGEVWEAAGGREEGDSDRYDLGADAWL